jgi:hypothetical protein
MRDTSINLSGATEGLMAMMDRPGFVANGCYCSIGSLNYFRGVGLQDRS